MAEGRGQRRLAAILAADVVGYSRLMGADEEGTLARLKELHSDLIEPTTAAFNGRIVKTTGDGVLIEFPSVVDAVRCAVEVQAAVAKQGAGVAEDRRLDLRIGIHLGDIMVEGDDLFGDGVNVAARLEGLARAGGIALSDDAYRQVRDKLDLGWADGGEVEVKNIARPVHVWRCPGRCPDRRARSAGARSQGQGRRRDTRSLELVAKEVVMAKRANLGDLKVVKPGDQKPLVSARGEMTTATVNLPRDMLTLLRRVAVNRADTAGGRPSVSDVVREILERHHAELEDEAR